MAKLSAHGLELFRMLHVDRPEADGLVEERSVVYAFMADGAILKRLSVVFKANGVTGRQPHSYGWTLSVKKARKGHDLTALEYQRQAAARLEALGFKRI